MPEKRIGVVGPCASGKTTLVAGLKRRGYQVRHIAQEHSYVQDMWKRITDPDVLVYLDVSYPVSMQRRKLNWNFEEFQEQLRRLEHAKKHANLLIHTDHLTPDDVLEQVLQYLHGTIDSA